MVNRKKIIEIDKDFEKKHKHKIDKKKIKEIVKQKKMEIEGKRAFEEIF